MIICTKGRIMLNLELTAAIVKDTGLSIFFLYPQNDSHGHPTRFIVEFDSVEERDAAFDMIHEVIGTNQLDF